MSKVKGFPSSLEALMKKRGFSLSRLAKEAGVPKATLHSWTTGVTPNLEQLRRTAQILKVSFHQLAFGEADPYMADEELLQELFSGDIRVTLHKIIRRT